MKYLSLLSLLALSASCMKEIDLEYLRPAPKLVLNSIASRNEPVTASLSRTWFYTDNFPNVTIKGARLNLYVNDRLIGEMNWQEEGESYYATGNYISSYLPASGDKIRIEAAKDGFNSVVAEETVPHEPNLLDFQVEDKSTETFYPYSGEYTFKITFRDDPAVENCYLICLYIGTALYSSPEDSPTAPPVYTGEYFWDLANIDYTSDPVFANKISIMDRVMGYDWLSGYSGRAFSDELFDGKEYTMTLDGSKRIIWRYNDQPAEVYPDSAKVCLYAISKGYYKYLTGLTNLNDGSLNQDLASIGFAEPMRVFSNIEGGLGILGAVCVDSLTVAVSKE